MTSFQRPAPLPRGKSCAACTKAKRRCDFALPACLRCSGRGIECLYPQRTRSSIMRMTPSHTPSTPSSASISVSTAVSPAPPPYTSPPSFSASALMDEILASGDPCHFDSYSLKDFDAGLEAGFGWDGRGAPGVNAFLQERSTADSAMTTPYQDMEGCGMGPPVDLSEQMTVVQRRLDDISDGVGETLRFAGKYLETIPRKFVETLDTPWCHREVFGNSMPKCLQDAIACSALYIAKTDQNKLYVMRTIVASMTSLSHSPAPITHRETLARAHALGMYNILALFDGDIPSRAAAESLLPEFESASQSLFGHITHDVPPNSNFPSTSATPRDLPLYPLAETESFWRTWILQQSTRRTALFTTQLLNMYALITKMKGFVPPAPRPLSCSLSGHLWGAGNAIDFAIAWGSRKHLVVDMCRLSDVLDEATGEDLDEFGRMLLACCMGEQEARGWLAAGGGPR